MSWIKFSLYKVKDEDSFGKLGELFSYLSSGENSEKEGRVEVSSLNLFSIPQDTRSFVDLWKSIYVKGLFKKGKGPDFKRIAYQLLINDGTPHDQAEKYKKNVYKFIKASPALNLARGVIFLHYDTKCVHAHLLFHAVTMENRALRLSKKVVQSLKEKWESSYAVYKPAVNPKVSLTEGRKQQVESGMRKVVDKKRGKKAEDILKEVRDITGLQKLIRSNAPSG